MPSTFLLPVWRVRSTPFFVTGLAGTFNPPFRFWLGELSAFAFEFDARSQLPYGNDTNGS